ncbi:unnamed protein product [Alternaria burnsii]|nr:unnamed protein product [Alternaria burnsii]
MCTGKHLAMAETAGVALVPSLYRKHGSRNWAEIRDQCTKHCDDIGFLTDDSTTARYCLRLLRLPRPSPYLSRAHILNR